MRIQLRLRQVLVIVGLAIVITFAVPVLVDRLTADPPPALVPVLPVIEPCGTSYRSKSRDPYYPWIGGCVPGSLVLVEPR